MTVLLGPKGRCLCGRPYPCTLHERFAGQPLRARLPEWLGGLNLIHLVHEAQREERKQRRRRA